MFKNIKNYIMIGVVAILFVVAGYFIFNKIKGKELPANLIAGSGRIDGDIILLNTKYLARVEKIFVKEGDIIKSNQIVAKLTSRELLSRLNGLKEAIEAAKKEKLSFSQTIKASKIQLKLLEKTLPKIVKIKDKNLKTLKENLKNINLNIDKMNLQ